MKNKKIKAVVFDMDGVLVDAKDWHYEALNKALALFGYSISRYDHLVTYDGLPTRRKLEMLTRERGFPLGLHAFVNRIKQSYTDEIIHARCKPTFQHEYALSRLKSDGFKLGLASNSIRHTVELMMTKTRLREYLDTMLSNEDVSKAKPDPEIYLKAASSLELKPEECLVVEDNENGIKSATAAGCPVMIVGNVLDVTFQNITQKLLSLESAR